MKKYLLICCAVILAVIAAVIFIGNKMSVNSPDSTFVTVTDLGEGPVSSVSVQLNAAGLAFAGSTDGKVSVRAEGVSVSAGCADGGLRVSGIEGQSPKNASVTVFLPKDTVLDSLSVSVGVGAFSAEDLRCRKAEIGCNVGAVTLSFADMPETLQLKTGTGDVSVTFPGTEQITLKAPYGLGGRDFSDRFLVDDKAENYVIDVSVGNTTLR